MYDTQLIYYDYWRYLYQYCSLHLCQTLSFELSLVMNIVNIVILLICSVTSSLGCTSVCPWGGITHLWLSLSLFLHFFYPLLIYRGYGNLLNPLRKIVIHGIWAKQINFDWLIENCLYKIRALTMSGKKTQNSPTENKVVKISCTSPSCTWIHQ